MSFNAWVLWEFFITWTILPPLFFLLTYIAILSGMSGPRDNYIQNKQQDYFLSLTPLQPAGLSLLVLDTANSNHKLNSEEQQFLLVPALGMTYLKYHPSPASLGNSIDKPGYALSGACPNTTIKCKCSDLPQSWYQSNAKCHCWHWPSSYLCRLCRISQWNTVVGLDSNSKPDSVIGIKTRYCNVLD